MTLCAVEADAEEGGTKGHRGFVIAADGSYGARLTADGRGDGWFPERWTLGGPEPYAVPLPGGRPEAPSAQVLPLADGRVVIARREAGAHRLALLYPSGPGTGELPLGTVDSPSLTLLPPTPDGRLAYALVTGTDRTRVWLVTGGAEGPQPVAALPGRCSGGVWLDREARLLALDRTEPGPVSRTKTVVVDLGRSGEVTPLLQITEESDDRLVLADPDSGLLVLRSDAPGEERLGWGVLGSSRPVRFPEALRPDGVRLTPFAVQPGQVLQPESCAVALRADGPNGTWVAVWRPSQRVLQHVAAPPGWLAGTGLLTEAGELRLPYAADGAAAGGPSTGGAGCGLTRVEAAVPSAGPEPRPPAASGEGAAPPRPVPLQQAPMARR